LRIPVTTVALAPGFLLVSPQPLLAQALLAVTGAVSVLPILAILVVVMIVGTLLTLISDRSRDKMRQRRRAEAARDRGKATQSEA